MKKPHRNMRSTVCSYCHNIHLPLLNTSVKIYWLMPTLTYSKALFNLIKFTLAIPATVFNYPIYSDCISCYLFLCTPQAPASLSAQAVSSCHNLYLSLLQHCPTSADSEGWRLFALLDHFLSVIPVPTLFQTIPFIASDI